MAKLQQLKVRIQAVSNRLQMLVPGSWRTDKQTSGQRGYTFAWQRARAAFLRAHPLCCYCEREGRVSVADVLDHRVPHRGDERLFWDESNWQPLCRYHHEGEKKREENALK